MTTTTPTETNRGQLSERIDKMTRALRVLGAILLLTSASSFLVHRWDTGQDLLRFGFLLAHSFVILGAALFCGGKLGESRSARVFLWTNLALVPAHFAVLGGLVYSQFALDETTLNLPNYAVWQAPSAIGVLLATVGAFVTVLPTSLISARVLAPRRAKVVTLLYVGLCSLLLVPLRVADAAAVLAAAGALIAFAVDRKHFAGDYRMRTWEGRLVRSLMAVPSVFLVARAVVFYPTTDVFIGLLISVAAAVGFVLSRGIKNNRASAEAGEWLSAVGGCVGMISILAGAGAFDAFGELALLGLAAVLAVASLFSKSSRESFEVGSAISAALVVLVGMIIEQSMLEGVLGLVIGAAVLAYSILMGRALVGTIAAFCTAGGIAVVFDQAIGFEHLSNWGTLSGMGICAVIVAALAERHRDTLIRHVTARFAREASEPVVIPTFETNRENPSAPEVDSSPSTSVA